MSGLIFGFLFVISLLFIAIRKRSLDLSPFQITYLHSLIKKISKHLPLYKLPSKASGLKYLIISYVDKLFLKQKIQFHISNDLVAYSSYSFKTFLNIKLYLSGIDVSKLFYLKMFIMYGNAIFTKEFIP